MLWVRACSRGSIKWLNKRPPPTQSPDLRWSQGEGGKVAPSRPLRWQKGCGGGQTLALLQVRGVGQATPTPPRPLTLTLRNGGTEASIPRHVLI